MSTPQKSLSHIKFFPLTPRRWVDFEALFGERGACGGCWCMAWRLTRLEYEAGKGKRNKQVMKRLIVGGHVPGILAYDGKIPIGWCSVAPREEFSFLSRSRVLSPIDDKPVWSISCFFVKKEYRAQGVSVALLQAAVEYVKKNKGKIVEGYPVVPYSDKMPDVFAWTGLESAYKKAGFKEAARRSKSRPIMRYYI